MAHTPHNPFLKDFQDQLKQRFAEEYSSMSYSDWILANTTLNKKKFSLKDYEFQQAILDDMSTNLAVIKCSQIGLTESQLRKFAAFLARNNGTKGIFTLPDDAMTKRVSQTRFGPMIANDQVFNHASRPIRSIDLCQINQSYGYFVGGKESAATSIDADILFHDETDLSDQEMLALFQSRLQGSDWRITQSFSTPTFEGYGIDALFRVSDQHEYLIKCPCCNHWNNPRWSPKHVRLAGMSADLDSFFDLDTNAIEAIDLAPDASFVFCTKCSSALDLHDPTYRQWVPKFPGRRSRGYKVTPFSTPKLTVAYILDQQQKYQARDAMRRFHNTVLGEPYNDEKARITELDIRAAMVQPSRPDLPPYIPVVFGLDMGLVCHLTMATLTSPQMNVFHWEAIPEHNLIDRLKELQSIYNIVGGAVDRYPYTPLSNEIRDLFNSTVMPVEYSTNGPDLTLSKDELGNPSHVRGNRTTILDTVSTAIRKKHWVFTGYGNQDSVIVQHLRDMVRIEKDDQSVSWNKLTGTDHYFHSLGYLGFARKIHQHQLHQSDQRDLFDFSTFTVKTRGGDSMGLQGRRASPISLGALY